MIRNPNTLNAKARFKTAGNATIVTETHRWNQKLELCIRVHTKSKKSCSKRSRCSRDFSITKECYKMRQ
jgi:hypothetical protein